MAFNAEKMVYVAETEIGKIGTWKGTVAIIAYKYDGGPLSVKVVSRGVKKDGSVYEGKIMNGIPVSLLKKRLLADLGKFVKSLGKE